MIFDPVWEQLFASSSWGQYPSESVIRFVARNFYKAIDRQIVKLLEVGCGPGANIWYIAREGFAFAGIDGSATAIAQASQRLDNESPGWRSRGELHVGDITKLPFADATFDGVIDDEAVYSNGWDEARAIYLEMARVLKSGGKLFSRTFTAGCWGDGTGEQTGHHAWRCADGPLAGKGQSRFTSREEIYDLVLGFKVTNIELLMETRGGNQSQEIREWIIEGERE